MGTTITEQGRQLFMLPVKDGGLGMPVLVEKANIDFQSSKFITGAISCSNCQPRLQHSLERCYKTSPQWASSTT